MISGPASPAALEQFLSRLLSYGTYVASGVIAFGLVVAFDSNQLGSRIATAGIALLIVLPVARVGAMLIFFLSTKDHRFSAIASLVLVIIVLSYLVGAG
jgi:uncharacterized membrane protein